LRLDFFRHIPCSRPFQISNSKIKFPRKCTTSISKHPPHDFLCLLCILRPVSSIPSAAHTHKRFFQAAFPHSCLSKPHANKKFTSCREHRPAVCSAVQDLYIFGYLRKQLASRD